MFLSVFYTDSSEKIYKLGEIKKIENFKLDFSYSPEWINYPNSFPLALSLPLNGKFTQVQVTSYFHNLLPEGELLKTLAKSNSIDEKDTFAFLKLLGLDVCGAFMVIEEENEQLNKLISNTKNYIEISELEISLFLRKGIIQSEVIHNMRYSLAGFQEKIALSYINSKYLMPLGLQPTTHILKADKNNYPIYIINEAFCMFLANELALDVAECEMISPQAQAHGLLIKRYDRYIQNGKNIRLHQQDFCQALGLFEDKKYDITYRSCSKVLSQLPESEKEKLVQWTIFNYLIENCDAHAKNLALVYDQNNKLTLAPFYDLLCTRLESQYTDNLSIAIGGEKKHSAIKEEHWEQYCSDIQISYPQFLNIMNTMLDTLKEKLPLAVTKFNSKHEQEFVIPSPAFLNETQIYSYFHKTIRAINSKIEKNMIVLDSYFQANQENNPTMIM